MSRLFYALILLSITCGSHAAEVDNLYQSQMPVVSQDQAERDRLTPQLLQQVLLKVSGNSQRINSADLTAVLERSTQYVQQYEYQRINPITMDLTQPDQLALTLKFDQRGVNSTLAQLGLPVWGKVRPDVLVWLALEEHGQQQLLGLENAPKYITLPLTQAAQQRGLPLLVPLLDLQDQTQLTFNDVWTGNTSAVAAASTRYGADVVVTGRIKIDEAGTEISWQTSINGEPQRWQSEGAVAEAISRGVGELTDKMAVSYTQVVQDSTSNQRFTLNVADVLDYADFSRVMTYLEQLDYITDIRVLNLAEQKLDLDIAYRGDMQVLQRTLSVGRLLVEMGSVDSDGSKQYRLVP